MTNRDRHHHRDEPLDPAAPPVENRLPGDATARIPDPTEPLPPAADESGFRRTEDRALAEVDKAVQGVRHTRSRATYVGWFIGLVIAILLLVFILMNQENSEIDLIFGKVDLPVGVSLLIAAIAGALITFAVTSARIFQLRRALKTVAKNSPSPQK